MTSRHLSMGEATMYSAKIARELNVRMPHATFDIHQHDLSKALAGHGASCAARTAFFGVSAANNGLATFFVRPESDHRDSISPPHASGFIEVNDPRFIGVGVDSFYDPGKPDTESASVYFVKRPPMLKGLSLNTLLNHIDSTLAIPSPSGNTTLEIRHFEAGYVNYQQTVTGAVTSTPKEMYALVDSLPQLEV